MVLDLGRQWTYDSHCSCHSQDNQPQDKLKLLRMANFVNAEDVRWFEQYILFKSMFNKTDVHVGRGDKAKNATRRRSRSRSPITVIRDHARSTEGAGMEGVRLPEEQAARQRVGGATSHANLAARQ